MVGIGTGSTIPIWWTFVFPNQKLYLSHKLIYVDHWCRRNLVLIDFDLLKARTSTNTKPEVLLSDRGRHLEKSIWRYISAAAGPEWHRNNGDKVKIEIEKSDGLNARHFSLVVQACKPGCYSYVRWCILAGVEQLYTGNLLTVVLAHYTHS